MDVRYILLGGKTLVPSGIRHVQFASFGENEGSALAWSGTDQQRSAPLAELSSQARAAEWVEDGWQALNWDEKGASREHWLKLHPDQERWLKLLPEQIVQYDPEKLIQSGAITRKDSPSFRDLQHVARQNISRKTAFVFPAKWPAGVETEAFELVRAMVEDVARHIQILPADGELPWTFLCLQQAPGGQGVLDEFIRQLHHKMLGDIGRVNIDGWRGKSGAILLSGPTGSGKSYAARLLATAMNPGSRPVEVNLAAIGANPQLLESRMRGYVPGTFTDGDKKGRKGWFEEAADGVLFLDEFQSVPPEIQVQLLDLLSAVSDDIHIAKVGADHQRLHCRVKVILAINEDLDTLLRKGKLRKDLYYRVRFIQTFLSLHERLAPALDPQHCYLRGLLASYRWKSQESIDKLSGSVIGLLSMQRRFFPLFEAETLALLARQKWDGNFRELERVAFDLFQQYDRNHGNDDRISPSEVKDILSSWHGPASPDAPNDDTDCINAQERQKLDDIQTALRGSKFIISKALKNQIRIGARVTLKKYLRDNAARLDADVRADSRIIRFLSP